MRASSSAPLARTVTAMQRAPPRVVCEGMGVSLPGRVDASGRLVFAPNLRWRDIDLASLLEAAIGLPVVLGGEDVRALMQAGEAEVDLEAHERDVKGRGVVNHQLLLAGDVLDRPLQVLEARDGVVLDLAGSIKQLDAGAQRNVQGIAITGLGLGNLLYVEEKQ